MEQLASDLASIVKFQKDELRSMKEAHVDDFIGIGNRDFFKECLLTSKHFKLKERIFKNIIFTRLSNEEQNKRFFRHQQNYISKLKELTIDITIDTFKESHHEIAQATHTHDLIYARLLQKRFGSENQHSTKKSSNWLTRMLKNLNSETLKDCDITTYNWKPQICWHIQT